MLRAPLSGSGPTDIAVPSVGANLHDLHVDALRKGCILAWSDPPAAQPGRSLRIWRKP